MPKKANTPEQIIGNLRQAEIMLNKGATVAEVCRKIEVTDQAHFRWRKEYGGCASTRPSVLKTSNSRTSGQRS